MILRPYQSVAIDAVIVALAENPILVAPTGSGKSVMGAALVARLGLKTYWLAHRTELIDQAADHLRRNGLSVGIVMADRPLSPGAQVQVASVDTLRNRAIEPGAGLLVSDECQHDCAVSRLETLRRFACPHVGMTATPFRLDGRGLGEAGYGAIVVAARPRELCENGTLHKPVVWSHPPPDLRGVRKSMGDYSISQLGEKMRELVGDIVPHWFRHASGRRTVAFAVDVEHSRMIAASFRNVGVPFEHLDGNTPRAERSAILDRLRTGETVGVSNCEVLTEGTDIPALECAIVARPTASLALHLQIVGRIMRACDGKSGAIVLDHAGNTLTHGTVTRHIEYTLDGIDKGKSEAVEAETKRCPECGLMVPIQTRVCDCGYVFVADDNKTPIDDDLVCYDENDPAQRISRYAELVDQGVAAGYKPGWAAYRYRDQFGDWPTQCVIMGTDPTHATIYQKESIYRHYLTIARTRGMQDGWASHRYKAEFGTWPSGFVTRVKSEISNVSLSTPSVESRGSESGG